MPVFYCRILNLGKWQSEAIAGVHSLENLKTGQGNGMRLEKQTVLSAAWFSQILGSWIFYMVDEVSHLIGKRSVQFSSVAQLCLTLCNPMDCSTPGLPVHHQHLEFTQTHVHWVSDAIQPFHPLSSPSPPALNPSQHQGLFKWVSSSHQVDKVLEFQLQHQSFQEYSGLISFRLGWLNFLEVQGTLKSLFQHHSSKASINWPPAFIIVQLSHPYMATGKTIALTRWTFVGKVASLLLNMLSKATPPAQLQKNKWPN